MSDAKDVEGQEHEDVDVGRGHIDVDSDEESEASYLDDISDNFSEDDVRSQGVFSSADDLSGDDTEVPDEQRLSYKDLLSFEVSSEGSTNSEEHKAPSKTGSSNPKASKDAIKEAKKVSVKDESVIKNLKKISMTDTGEIKKGRKEIMPENTIEKRELESPKFFNMRKEITNKIINKSFESGLPLEKYQAITLGAMIANKVKFGVSYTKEMEATIEHFRQFLE